MNPKPSLFLAGMFSTCTVFSVSLPEDTLQYDAQLVQNVEPSIRSEDPQSENDDRFSADGILIPDASTFIQAPNIDHAGSSFEEPDSPWSINLSNGIDVEGSDLGSESLSATELIPTDSTAFLDPADPGEEGPCSGIISLPPPPSSSLSKYRRNNHDNSDASCPAAPQPEQPLLSPDNERGVIPSDPDILIDHESDPEIPINAPLFQIEQWDDFRCVQLEYWTHLCCDGPRGTWVERWNHYDYVLSCLPCT